MHVFEYPKCCMARCIGDFGYGHINEKSEDSVSYEEVKKYLLDTLINLKRNKIPVVFACPTGTQPGAIQALAEQGFITTTQEPFYESVTYTLPLERDEYGQYKTENKQHKIIPMILDLSRWEPVV